MSSRAKNEQYRKRSKTVMEKANKLETLFGAKVYVLLKFKVVA
jgi:hypothetical protein